MVAPIAPPIGASQVIAARMEVSAGRYTEINGVLRLRRSEADPDARAGRHPGYRLPGCLASTARADLQRPGRDGLDSNALTDSSPKSGKPTRIGIRR